MSQIHWLLLYFLLKVQVNNVRMVHGLAYSYGPGGATAQTPIEPAVAGVRITTSM